MTDQCKHCTLRGDIKSCKAALCFQHESWYALEQEKIINQLREENKRLKESNKVLSQYIEDCRPKLHPPFFIDTTNMA